MALSNRDRVGKGLDLLAQGLRPLFMREMHAALGDTWAEQAAADAKEGSSAAEFRDVYVLLKAMWDYWHPVFGKVLGHAERTLVSELRDVRNRWAHNEPFTADDAYRALDSVHRLLLAVSAHEAVEADHMKQEMLRIRFAESAKKEVQRAAQGALEGMPMAGLKSWRMVIKPHDDVSSGRYQTAEFAADLGQVHRGEGSDEYREPREFFRRTYMTDGLRSLLVRALKRLTGTGGDPVIELQTNFGGGKTHSLLALYHLVSGADPGALLGVDAVLKEAGVSALPSVNRAVLVGTAISPGQPDVKADGTEVRTLWGEMAWQLGGAEGYAIVAEADRTGTNPGTKLNDLLRTYAPCMVLIDEWVAYARQLYANSELPAGTFDTHFTFAQALTEAAAAVPGALLVVSIPASDKVRAVEGAAGDASAIEVGGEGGVEALRRLKAVVERVAAQWQPASADEAYEIVRRRLFEQMTDPDAFTARDAVIDAFMNLYRAQSGDFPGECREAEYRRRLEAAYPIHPEVFQRLYSDWSTLERFQRTRGVLRLMAAVIHALWVREDAGLLILPGTIPIDDSDVRFELTRYVEDTWKPVIERDVDGPTSLPVALDKENPNLGRYSAARRVARTVYMGSAPTAGTTHPGLEDKRIKLGCTQPGETPAVFGDALRHLSDKATHLYTDGSRYWFATQPSVTRLAQERAEQLPEADVHAEMVKLVRAECAQRSDFCAVHVAPDSPGDVPDEDEVRLVVLGPRYPHSPKVQLSEATKRAQEILESKGSAPRRFRNMVVFLAPDRTALDSLDAAVRMTMAWESIVRDSGALNLDAFQSSQAISKLQQAKEAAQHRVYETFQWVIVPSQPDPQGGTEWRQVKAATQGQLPERVARKLKHEEQLLTEWAGVLLRHEMDKVPLWPKDSGHISVKQLWELFAQYLYLPRLKDMGVLSGAIQSGVMDTAWQQDTFAYAEAYDEASGRYKGLKCGEMSSVHATGLVVHPDHAVGVEPVPVPGTAPTGGEPGGGPPAAPEPAGPAEYRPKRFFGVVTVDPERLGRDAGLIAQEVVGHLQALPGAKVTVQLEIAAEIPEGAPENVVRTVSENARTLKFEQQGFEEE
ncbi:MAG: Swt1 family HEPN domain-containing protein [Coriobacteriia bacterium]